MWYCTAIKKPTNIIDKPPTSAQYWQQKQAQHAIPYKTTTLKCRGIDKHTLGDMLCY